jgi:acylphosphatase
MRCRRCYVSGRVQGVFFRASTRRQAELLGLTGYARNLDNGDVEVLMCGESSQLDSLQDWLWQGSRWSDVSDVKCEAVSEHPPGFFSTE